jgi:hypothetical protein
MKLLNFQIPGTSDLSQSTRSAQLKTDLEGERRASAALKERLDVQRAELERFTSRQDTLKIQVSGYIKQIQELESKLGQQELQIQSMLPVNPIDLKVRVFEARMREIMEKNLAAAVRGNRTTHERYAQWTMEQESPTPAADPGQVE